MENDVRRPILSSLLLVNVTVDWRVMRLTLPSINISATVTTTGLANPNKVTLVIAVVDPGARLMLTSRLSPKETWQPRAEAPAAKTQVISAEEEEGSATTSKDCNPVVSVTINEGE